MVPARYRQNTLLPINSLLNEFFSEMNLESSSQLGFRPPLDLKEDENHFYVLFELPGIQKEEVKISIKKNILTICGEKKKEELLDKEEYRQIERSYGVFKRCFRLPQVINEEAISAEMENGILKISIPKIEKVEPRQIAIN